MWALNGNDAGVKGTALMRSMGDGPPASAGICLRESPAATRAPAQAGDVMRYGVCVVLGMLSFASSAGAQDMSRHWARCLNKQEAFTADQSIEGCTAVIQAARDVPANMAIAFNSRGNSHAAKDQPDCAIEDYDQAIRLNPNYAAPHHNRGGVYLDRAQYDRAIQDFDQAIRLNPNDVLSLVGRGLAWHRKG